MEKDRLILIALIVGSLAVAALAAFIILDDRLIPRVPQKVPIVVSPPR